MKRALIPSMAKKIDEKVLEALVHFEEGMKAADMNRNVRIKLRAMEDAGWITYNVNTGTWGLTSQGKIVRSKY